MKTNHIEKGITLEELLRCIQEIASPCRCRAHLHLEHLLRTAEAEGECDSAKYNEADDIRSLIRTDVIRTGDEGLEFILTLLRRIFSLCKVTNLKWTVGGRSFGVSYILMHKNCRHPFKEVADM